jgi:uncharacterized membrane protein (Fun14 family)
MSTEILSQFTATTAGGLFVSILIGYAMKKVIKIG